MRSAEGRCTKVNTTQRFATVGTAKMGFVTYVLCLPARALLYVLLKPPFLVYALIKYCVLSIVSVPAYYLGRLRDRVKVLWNWSYRPSLPWWSRPCTAKGTQTLDCREETLDLSAVPHISPSLGLEPGHARRDLALARSCSKRRPPIWRQRLSEEAERLGQSRVELSHREALAVSLITLLLQPMSPPDSDSEEEEEEEKPTTAAYMEEEEEEETKRALQLILDLVKLSKSHTTASSPTEPPVASLQQAADVAAMRRHARDHEKLQNLISELDRLAVEVDPASLLHRRRPRRREDRRERSRSRSPSQPLSPSTEEDQVSSEETTDYQEADTSLDTDTDQLTEATERSSPDLQEGEGESEKLDQAAHMESERGTHTYPTQLSPVQESPEYSRRSTSVESISHLESDLNTALSWLDTETSDLRVEEDVLASFETQMGRERPNRLVATPSQGTTSLSSLHSTTGSVITEGDATVWSTRLSQSEDVFEDCSEDFSTIPATPPSLGLKEGHDRRDLAVARSSSKRRPPTRKSSTNPEQTSEVVSDKVPDMKPEEPIVEEEEEEMAENENRRLEFVPTLSDQIHLLKPGFPIHSGPDTESESTLATSSNPTELPAPTHSQASEKGVSVESRRQGSAEPESKGAQEPSLRISSSEPPWIEMRRKSKDTPPPPALPTLEKPPKISMLEPDKKDSEDSIYDTLEPLETRSHEAMYETLPCTKYLHQTIPVQPQQKQDSPHSSPSPHPSLSPQLPPRNPTHKTPVVEEREGRSHHRHSSRHHSSSSSPSERPSASSKQKDKHGSESSRKHRSHSSDRELRSSSSRRSSSDKHSTDKQSGSHSRSREHSSSHSERHSDKHRSHSSEKHSHSSSKSRESDGKKKASNPAKVKDAPKEEGRKHSSSSRDSSKSKSESSRSKSDSSKSKSDGSRSKSDSSKSKSESSKSSKSRAAEKTSEKSSKPSSHASSLKASSTPTEDKALMKSTSLTSLKSQGGASLVLESGKETEV